MFFTHGAILTAIIVLLCSLAIVTASICWLVARARRSSRPASAATPPEKAPEAWESRLRELEVEQASLSSSFEKVLKQLMRLNSRAGMRELRAEQHDAPPPGASKAELRRFYGFTKDGPEFAKRQLSLVPKE